jgi:hypothetical protein
VKRLIPLLLLLTGCSAAPVATTTPSSTTESTMTTVTTTSPRINTPRKLVAESFKVLAHLRKGNADQVAAISQGKARQAFKRLVTS